jgi:5'-deoxynucleotidase YfbR-like HD superfamily hydrolase
MEESSMTAFIETFTGQRFFPLEPRLEDIDIVDIAHALSNQCRFAGHVREFYSVAEHSVRVSWLIEEWSWEAAVCLKALLHDASEAYLVDFPTPLKNHSVFGAGYRIAEDTLMEIVLRRFSLTSPIGSWVKDADAVLLATEARDLMPFNPAHWGNLVEPLEEKIQPVSPREAKQMFLDRFYFLEAKRAA